MKILTPPTNMPTYGVNLMQLVCFALLSASVGGLGTFVALTSSEIECRVYPPATQQSDAPLQQFMKPDAPLPMDGGKRY